MKSTRRITTYLSIFCFVLLSTVFVSEMNAQGRYVGRYNRTNVDQIVKDLENSSNQFNDDFKNEVNDRRFRGNANDAKQKVQDFENGLDRLRSQFDRDNDWWQSRNQVQQAIQLGQAVNQMMTTGRGFSANLTTKWTTIRDNINRLADTYDLPGVNGGGWNGGTWNPNTRYSGAMSAPPSWATGTFYARLSNGSPITMTIANNGAVTANVDGLTYYGAYNRGSIVLNGDTSTVTSVNNGIRTVNRNSGEVTSYSKSNNGRGSGSGSGWGNNNNNTYNGAMSSPPSWARGTFYARLSNGSPITMTIADNGRVTANVNGMSYAGAYNNGNIYLNGDTSTVSSVNNGIRTINRSSGEVTNYSKSNNGWGTGNGTGWGNNNTNTNNGPMSAPPSWARGTFKATLSNGAPITMTIDNNGRVTAVVNGSTYYGSFYNQTITLNGDTSSVVRNGRGIRTTNNNSGEQTNYNRQ